MRSRSAYRAAHNRPDARANPILTSSSARREADSIASASATAWEKVGRAPARPASRRSSPACPVPPSRGVGCRGRVSPRRAKVSKNSEHLRTIGTVDEPEPARNVSVRQSSGDRDWGDGPASVGKEALSSRLRAIAFPACGAATAVSNVTTRGFLNAASPRSANPPAYPQRITRSRVSPSAGTVQGPERVRTAPHPQPGARHANLRNPSPRLHQAVVPVPYADDCVEVLASLAWAYAQAGDRGVASEAVEAAARIADRIIYYPDRSRAFTAMWKARILMGDVEDAR